MTSTSSSTDHKPEEVLEQELQGAAEQVPVGALYAHYKHPERLYEIVGHAILEATDEPAVLYRKQYGKVTYVRALSVWLETVEWEGKTVPRFTKTNTQ